MLNILLILLPVFILSVNFILIKQSFLLNFNGDKHQKFVTKKEIPLSGGFFLFAYLVIFFIDHPIIIFATSFFLIGLLSDIKKINSAVIRLILQISCLYFFINLSNLALQNTGVDFFDALLENNFFNQLFVLFCILIIINGTNFIDGLNTNVLGYYIILSAFLYYIEKDYFIQNLPYWNYWIIILIILFIFNLFNSLFLGDSGSYLLGFIYGFILVDFYNFNHTSISSLYIILLSWYPCYEILFSIIRKFRFNRSPVKPDTKHLHQFIYILFKTKFKLKEYNANILSAILINFCNFIIINFASLNISNTKYQLVLILISISFYTLLYLFFFKKIILKN